MGDIVEGSVKSLADMLSRLYGVRTTHRINPIHVNPIVAVVQSCLGANPKRLGHVIVNMGVNSCWVAPRDTVADDYGIVLVPNGGSVSKIWDEDFEMVTLPWYVISVAAPGTNIFVMEVMIF